MIDMMYVALPMRAQTEKTIFSCKDGAEHIPHCATNTNITFVALVFGHLNLFKLLTYMGFVFGQLMHQCINRKRMTGSGKVLTPRFWGAPATFAE